MTPDKDYADYLLDQHLGGDEEPVEFMEHPDSEIPEDDCIYDDDGEIIGHKHEGLL